jgi:transcriptional regulator with XRE-family HTH domain
VFNLQSNSLQMKDRIILLIKAKNLTAAQFADEIGVQKSSISHIISGRNNASLDFIQKVLLRFPEVNMEWLMFGKGPLFKGTENALNNSNDAILSTELAQNSASVDLFSDLITGQRSNFHKETDLSKGTILEEKNKQDDMKNESLISETENKNLSPIPPIANMERVLAGSGNTNTATKTIVKIVEFYSDNTYKEYFPG